MAKITQSKLDRMKPGDLPLSGEHGLTAVIGSKGIISFKVRWTLSKKVRGNPVIGHYPTMSFSEAKKRAKEMQAQVRDGINPSLTIVNSDSDKSVRLFMTNADAYILRKRKDWSEEHYERVVGIMDTLKKYIGHMDVESIQPRHITPVRDHLFQQGYSTMTIGLNLIKKVSFQAFRDYQIGGNDPSAIHREIMSEEKPEVKNADFILRHQFSDLADLLNVQTKTGWKSPLGIGMLMHSLTRKNEIISSYWREYDLENRLLTIERGRTKQRRKHLVPISDELMDYLVLLAGITGRWGKNDPVFPNDRDSTKPMSGGAMNNLLTRHGWGDILNPHGTRGTNHTELAQVRKDDRTSMFDERWIDAQLGHKLEGVKAHYNHAAYLDHRRDMINWYSKHLASFGISATHFLQVRFSRRKDNWIDPTTVLGKVVSNYARLKKVEAFRPTLKRWEQAGILPV